MNTEGLKIILRESSSFLKFCLETKAKIKKASKED